MTHTVVGLFRDSTEAQAALHDLESAGFTREHLSLVAYDGSQANSEASSQGSEMGSNTTKGATMGGVAGLLLGLAAVAIPGIGPVVAAGPIAAALAGAGVGAAAGGILGALADMGIPGHEAKYYQEAIRRGGTLVIVRTDDQLAEKAQSILDRHGAIDVSQLVSSWVSETPQRENVHSQPLNLGDEGGSAEWPHRAQSAAEARQSRVYPTH